jgi:membrane associated rhomboid family serine protease
MNIPDPILIPARSKRQAMDWALVLASQDIVSTVVREEHQWGVLVEEADLDRAQNILSQWHHENRGWKWRQNIPVTNLAFHWGSLLWAAALAALYAWSENTHLKDVGMMNATAVMAGQWWRLFTAVTLHADPGHLMSNAVSGSLLLGLAMARYGVGIALLATYLGGVAGNVAGLFLFAHSGHLSLGASGMVMAALGMISVQSIIHWRKNPAASSLVFRALGAGVLILLLTGFSPESDIVAHVGGFIGGLILGLALNWIPPKRLQEHAVNLTAGIAVSVLLLTTWGLAIAH